MNHKHEPGKLISIAAVILFAVLLLAAALTAPMDPGAILDEANRKNSELTDMDMSMVMDIAMGISSDAAEEEKMNISADMNMKFTGLNTEQMVYLADTTMTMEIAGMNQSLDTRMFYKDGFCYVETMGQKFKYAMDLDAMLTSLKSNTALTQMNSEFMTDLSAEKKGDDTVISFTGDPDKMNEYIQNMFAFMGQQMPTEGIEMTITEFYGTLTVNKDGYFSAEDIRMSYAMKMEAEGEEAAVCMDADVKAVFNNPGQTVSIQIPDTADYMEIPLTPGN